MILTILTWRCLELGIRNISKACNSVSEVKCEDMRQTKRLVGDYDVVLVMFQIDWLCLAASSMQRNCEACNNFLRIVKSAASCLVNKYTSILNMNNRNISNVSTQDSYLVSYNKT